MNSFQPVDGTHFGKSTFPVLLQLLFNCITIHFLYQKIILITFQPALWIFMYSIRPADGTHFWVIGWLKDFDYS